MNIKPISNITFEKENKWIAPAVAVGTLGASAFLIATRPTSITKAYEKAGLKVIGDKVVHSVSGQEFTGTVKRFEKRNRKELATFTNGELNDLTYYNLFGKEQMGYFFKDGKIKFRVSIVGNGKKSAVSTIEYKDNTVIRSHGTMKKGTVFDYFRNLIRKDK